MKNKFVHSAKTLFPKIITLITFSLWLYNFCILDEILSPFFRITFITVSIFAIFITLFAFIPWYGKKYKGRGIELHFEKVFTPTLYTFLVINILFTMNLVSLIMNIILIFLYGFLLTTNVLLLYLHFQDKDKTPPSHYAKS